MPEIIPWAEVPEGPVWFRIKAQYLGGGEARWLPGIKRGDEFSGGGVWQRPHAHGGIYEFAAAEQGPGALADALESTHYANGVADLAMKHRDVAEADLTRLRAGLAALEQAVDAYLHWLNDTSQSLDQEFKNRRGRVVTGACALIAALREGR